MTAFTWLLVTLAFLAGLFLGPMIRTVFDSLEARMIATIKRAEAEAVALENWMTSFRPAPKADVTVTGVTVPKIVAPTT